jgi:GNAT superfamily N-acetyltransferase
MNRGTGSSPPAGGARLNGDPGYEIRSSVPRMLRELTGEERAAYFRGIQPIWGGGLSEDRFQIFQRRLADAPEAKDRYRLLGWFVDGTLMSAMKTYDLRGSCAGKPIRILGVGAVFTPPELRRQGHAAAMLRAAMQQWAGQGASAAVLFSDIGVRYYERLGFRLVDCRECAVEAAELPRASGGVRPALAGDEGLMTRLFADGRGQVRRFALARDGWTLRFQLRRLRELARARGLGEPEWGLVAEGRFGEGAAMVRLARDSVDVLDAAWTSEAARERILGGLRDCLQRVGRSRLRFWPAGQLEGLFAAPERTSALAMIGPLNQAAPLPGSGAPTDLALLDHI